MKKIINKKLYDTETAKLIEFYQNLGNSGDANYYYEELFQKKTKEFFLHGHGNPYSKYGTMESINMWSGGSEIIPLTVEEARQWMEEYGHVDKYIELFGTPEE